MTKFKDKLYEWRTLNGLNQEQAGLILNMSKRNYQYYEWGQKECAPKKQQLLLRLMNDYNGTPPNPQKPTDNLYTANRIIQLRKQQNLTQKQFAESIGLTQGAITQIENGHPISDQTLMKISKRYNVSVSDLVPYVETEKPRFDASNEALVKENEMLRDMLKMKDEMLRSKDEMIELLKQRQ